MLADIKRQKRDVYEFLNMRSLVVVTPVTSETTTRLRVSLPLKQPEQCPCVGFARKNQPVPRKWSLWAAWPTRSRPHQPIQRSSWIYRRNRQSRRACKRAPCLLHLLTPAASLVCFLPWPPLLLQYSDMELCLLSF